MASGLAMVQPAVLAHCSAVDLGSSSMANLMGADFVQSVFVLPFSDWTFWRVNAKAPIKRGPWPRGVIAIKAGEIAAAWASICVANSPMLFANGCSGVAKSTCCCGSIRRSSQTDERMAGCDDKADRNSSPFQVSRTLLLRSADPPSSTFCPQTRTKAPWAAKNTKPQTKRPQVKLRKLQRQRIFTRLNLVDGLPARHGQVGMVSELVRKACAANR